MARPDKPRAAFCSGGTWVSKAKLKTLSLPARRDLVVLAADLDAEQVMTALFSKRTKSLRIRSLKHDIIRHPEHDPGCLLQSGGILSVYARTHDHAVVVFDRDGSGKELKPREHLEAQVEAGLAAIWGNRAVAIVIDPELEAWVWNASAELPGLLGWPGDTSLPEWLVEKGFLETPAQVKPAMPKNAMRAVLSEARRKPSSAIFRQIAEKISFGKCTDPAFLKLLTTLRKWFPAAS